MALCVCVPLDHMLAASWCLLLAPPGQLLIVLHTVCALVGVAIVPGLC